MAAIGQTISYERVSPENQVGSHLNSNNAAGEFWSELCSLRSSWSCICVFLSSVLLLIASLYLLIDTWTINITLRDFFAADQFGRNGNSWIHGDQSQIAPTRKTQLHCHVSDGIELVCLPLCGLLQVL